MKQNRVDRKVREDLAVGGGVRGQQLVPRVPDSAGDQATAGMAAAVARILHVVVGVAQRGIAVAEEAVGEPGVVRDQDAHDIAHALAIQKAGDTKWLGKAKADNYWSYRLPDLRDR